MKTDGRVLLGAILGKDTEHFFVAQMDDFMYFVRSMALSQIDANEEETKDKLLNICQNILKKTVKFFLMNKFGMTDDGTIKVIVQENELFDINKRSIKEVVLFKKEHKVIGEQMFELAWDEYQKGRILFTKIVERAKNFKAITKDFNRDYSILPPFENMEIEIIRLEKKLPFLSHTKGKRLAELYDKWHTRIQMGREMSMERH